MRFAGLRWVCLLLTGFGFLTVLAQKPGTAVDSDHDGLSDVLEQQILEQFSPAFHIGKNECAGMPTVFQPGLKVPTPSAEDGTIYGQVFPVKSANAQESAVEVHYYHLWARDCGSHGHALDTEHVAVLLRGSGAEADNATWKAAYWYAAAHENTVCDVSQIARASTLHAETKGAKVWISPGKHASYLDATLCARGCGADRCEEMKPLKTARIINLGEIGEPMNESAFVKSTAWPLAAKMRSSNFPALTIARVEALPVGDIAWYNAGRHPAQGIIAISASTEGAIAGSGANTADALGTAGENTTGALATAGDHTTGAVATAGSKTGNALGKSFRSTRHALGLSVHHVGKALGADPEPKPSATPQ